VANTRKLTRGRTDHFGNIFPCDRELVTLAFDLDLDSIKINYSAKYLGQKTKSHVVQKLLSGHPDRHTHKHAPDQLLYLNH